MEPLKVTFDRELTFEGKTFEKEAVYGYPKEGEHYVGESGLVERAHFNFASLKYPILTQKKKVYTVIKVVGEMKVSSVYGVVEADYFSRGEIVSVQTVEE